MRVGRGGDYFDNLCMLQWVPHRRLLVGVRLAKTMRSSEFLGAMTGTLGAIREEGEGASYSVHKQYWPEGYPKEGLPIQRAFVTMSERRRVLMDLRYTLHDLEPNIPIKLRAEHFGVSVSAFWDEVKPMKAYIEGFIASLSSQEKVLE